MNPALLTPSGLPRAGLVCWHDLWFPNLCAYSETPALWTKYKQGTGIDPVVTVGQTDPLGGTGAVRLELSVGEGTSSSDQSVVSLSGGLNCTPVGPRYTHVVWARSRNGVECTVNLSVGGTNILAAPTIPASGEWVLISGSHTVALNSYFAVKCWGVKGSKSVDIDVWHPQCYPCDSADLMPPYAPTTTLQMIPDLSGHGNTLYRGSNTSAADTNDPTVLGPGLNAVTDDYAETGVVGGVVLQGPWSLLVACKKTYTDTIGYVASFGSSATMMAGVRDVGTDIVGIRRTDAGGGANSGNLALTDGTVGMLCLSCASGVVSLTRLDTGASVSVAAAATFTGTANKLSFGKLVGGLTQVQNATFYESLLYNRVLSAAELQRVRRYVQSKWAARGVTIL